jgi:hypothetical protein
MMPMRGPWRSETAADLHLCADPLEDIRVTKTVEKVFLAGNEVR